MVLAAPTPRTQANADGGARGAGSSTWRRLAPAPALGAEGLGGVGRAVAAWTDGAVVAGSSAGAMALCDPMVDPRGGAFTLGLGLIEQLAVIPHHNTWSPDKEHRTLQLAAKGLCIVGIDEATALIRDPDGAWRTAGAGEVEVFVDGKAAGLDALPVTR